MSTSLGKYYTLRYLLYKNYDPLAVRYLLLSSHYRQQFNFTEEGIKAANKSIQRLKDFTNKLRSIKNKSIKNGQVKKLIEQTKNIFEKEIDDDLEISNALAAIFDFVKKINTFIMKEEIGKNDADNE